MRLFIATQVEKSIIENILLDMQPIIQNEKSVKWEHQDKIHITLKFLGDIHSALVNELDHILATIKSPPFTLNVQGLGAFPNVSNARIIWAGVKGDLEAYTLLFSMIENALEYNLSIQKEKRKFTPHLTLGRVKNLINTNTKKFILTNYKLYGSFSACNFSLVESILKPSGSEYSIINNYEYTS